MAPKRKTVKKKDLDDLGKVIERLEIFQNTHRHLHEVSDIGNLNDIVKAKDALFRVLRKLENAYYGDE